jgi:isoleucyl-tRNA synthetase
MKFPISVKDFVDKSLRVKCRRRRLFLHWFYLFEKGKIKVRQPLQKVMIPALDATFRAEIEAVADLIKPEVNAKEILDDALESGKTN